jgi:poly-gamma-glutamate biosynthesis protein PgsC/CapC
VPGYLALFLSRPLEIALTAAAAAGVMCAVKLASRLFFLFGRRRYVLCLLLGMLCKLGIERVYQGFAPDSGSAAGLIGWLIPGIIANDMCKQGIVRTALAAATVTALVFLLAQARGNL